MAQNINANVVYTSNGVMMCAINVEAEEEFFQSHHAST